MLIDSHCHLDRLKLDKFDDSLDAVMAHATEQGVEKMLCVGISLDNREAVVAMAENYPQVVSSVGVHPLDVEKGLATAEQLVAWSAHPKVVALGETGLDYYYSNDSKSVQQDSFVVHLQAAAEAQLPVIVHTRDARQDTLDLIKAHGCMENAGVLHCFTESWEMAKAAMDMNYYISFSGIVTFKNATELRDVASKVPLDRMLVETDSPYLAPVPYRGKANVPGYVKQVAEFIAELKGVSYQEVIRTTSENFHNLFKKAV
ncbi:MAG: TatD family hydrolase [Candidatus Pelagadaptatus aseana]|uniref:TatD family hydrolase n=1 Tax=Candidatus Pelagadaptatus aseana TaxID=3120508 RepID=UPI0039B241B4